MSSVKKSTGLIVRIKGSDYFVIGDEGEVRCSLRGRFRLDGDPEGVLPVIGDMVEFREEKSTDFRGPTGVIVTILSRKSIFARSNPIGKRRYNILCANLDMVFLVLAVLKPRLNLRLVDRMLVAAECGHMEPVICINKMDLAENVAEEQERMLSYRNMDYKVFFCSALLGSGLDPIRELMRGEKSILVGPSGTGKTSLVSALQPGLKLKVEQVSAKTGKGRHTTAHLELHPLDGGGYLGDTPGIREFGIWGVSKENLDEYFRDFVLFKNYCRFTSCTHSHEPACAVKEAVEGGLISRGRYDSYLRILSTL